MTANHTAPPRRAPIVAAILALVLLPVAVMILFAVVTARKALTAQIFETATSEGRGAALSVAEDLQGKRETVALVTTRRLLRIGAARRDRAEVERHLREVLASVPDFERAFVADPAGTLWAHHPASDESVVGRNFADREWYRGVTVQNGTYVTGAYERAARPVRLVHAFAAPIYDLDNRLAAYLVVQDAGARLGERLARLSRTDQPGRGTAVVDHNGRRVFHVGTPGIPAEIDLRPRDECVRSALHGHETVQRLTQGDEEFLIVCTPVPDSGWATVTRLPLSVVLDPVQAIAGQLAGGGLVLLAVAGVLGMYWARTFARNRELLARTTALNRKIETQRERYWSLLDSSADGLALADGERTLLYMNRGFGRFFGIEDVEALVGKPVNAFRERLVPLLEEPEKYLQAMEYLWSHADATSDFEVTLKDGRAIHFYSHPVRAADGALLGRSLVCRDLTREREVERIKNEFVATVSHELRTPLASLLGFSELMLTRELPDDKRRQFLELIHNESKRLNELINDFLDLQRVEAGRVSYRFEPLEAGEFLREATALYANRPSHPLRLDLAPDLPPFAADRNRLMQVMHNLLSNAVKFSPRGGEIAIAARPAGGEAIEIAVSDRGLGIPPEAMPGLFGKFYRVDSSDRRAIGGTGLGLALCKEIAEAHGGTIRAESVPGAGSTFRLTLPLKPRRIAPAERRRTAPVTDNAPHDVLIVEDDNSFAALVQEHLAEAGLTARTEPTAEGALAALRASPARMVLLDIHLAGSLDGWDLLITIKADPKLAGIPVIITTVTDRRERGLALGASDYLVKPFPMTDLIGRVRRFLPEAEPARVLVVDDDAGFRTAVVETLRHELHCVTDEADNGTRALEKISQRIPDLVVLDLLMPGAADGFAVLDALRARAETAHVPVLVVTGKTLTADEKARLRHGMARVLAKTEYSRQHLSELVRELLGATAGPA